MKKIIISILVIIIYNTSTAQNFYKLMGEYDGKNVKLMWFIYKWNPAAIGVDVKKRVGNGEWKTVNTSEIIPSLTMEKDLSYADSDESGLNKLKRKLSTILGSGKYKTVSSTDYLKKLKTDSAAMLSLTFLFVNDFDLAMLNGFGLTDRDVPNGDVEYGLFFHGISADKPLASYTFASGKSSLSNINYTLKFKPNLLKTVVNIYYQINMDIANKSNYQGVNIYKKKVGGNWEKLNQTPIWFTTIGKTKEPYYLDEKIEKGASYIYSLAPVSIFGTEGEKTEQTYNPNNYAGTILPSSISENKKATDGDGLGLSWTFDSTKESYIKGFIIQRKPNLNGEYTDISSLINSNQRTYKDVTNKLYNNYHFYRIKTIPNNDQSMQEIIGKEVLMYYRPVLKPAIPQGLRGEFVTQGDKRYIYLKWDKNADRFTKGYRIYASFPPSTKLSWQGDIPLLTENEYKFPVTNFDAADYHFSITGISELEDESKLSQTIIVTSPSSVMPNVNIWPFKVDSNQIAIEWKYTAPADLKGFRLYENGKLLLDETILKAEARKYTFTSMEYNTNYKYELEAVSKNNVVSQRSIAVNIMTDRKKK